MADTYIETAIRTRLLADTTIASYVSMRIYYMEVPAVVTYPYILVQTISDSDENYLVGTDGSSPRLQIDTVDTDDTIADAKAIDLAVRASLNDFSGTLSGLTVYIIERAGARELKEPAEKIIRISRDFIIRWERP